MSAKASAVLLSTAVTTDGVSDAERVTQLVPGASVDLAQLSDGELLMRTRQLVARSNQVLAALLMHLSEVEARGIYRTRACSSLYTYCIYELRFSEDAAARRSSAAKLVRRFPALMDAIAAGELHLTGLLMLGPHLTDENHVDVLARAKFRTKKELGRLIRRLAPLPQVPDSIAPLRPDLPKAPRNPTWAEFVESLAPPVRELRPGERPNDWANDMFEAGGDGVEKALAVGWSTTASAADEPTTSPARFEAGTGAGEPPPLTEPLLYLMQFTANQEHVQLVERAKALLARQAPGQSLGDLHLQAMRLLVEALEKRRFGAKAKPRREPTPQRDEAVTKSPRQRRQRGRYIAAALRRAVFERDGGTCAFLDERGERCREMHGLEIHHLTAFAKGGPHVLADLALRCQAHNSLAAEQDFGRGHIARKRDGSRHEARCRQGKPP